MVVLSQTERRQLARIEDDLQRDQHLARLSALFASPPPAGAGRDAGRSARPPGRSVWPGAMPAPPGAAAGPPQSRFRREETSRARTAGLGRMRSIAGLVFCAAVGLLAVGLLTASVPAGVAMLLLAPLIALATIVALRGVFAAGSRAWARRRTVGGSLLGGASRR